MAVDWEAKQKKAYEKIKAKGFLITVIVEGDKGEFDGVAMDFVGGTADREYQPHAIRSEYRIDQIDGTIVQISDSMLIIPAYGMPKVTADNVVKIGRASCRERV